MRQLSKRIGALEAHRGGVSSPLYWLRIIGRTEEEARAAYEAEHGPIAPEAGIIFRMIVEPRKEAK